jgi:hypothetical protein
MWNTFELTWMAFNEAAGDAHLFLAAFIADGCYDAEFCKPHAP